MSGPLTLARVVQTSIAAPSQWSAWTTDGTQLHLRYRHGRGRVESEDGTQLPADVLAHWDDRGGSFITLEDFMSKAGITLADDAEVVPYTDPREGDAPDQLRDAAQDVVLAAAEQAAGAPAAPAAPSGPVPFLEGSFALYTIPGGGAVLAYRAKGSSESKQLMIPPVILQMAGQASGLSPEAILSRIQSGAFDG